MHHEFSHVPEPELSCIERPAAARLNLRSGVFPGHGVQPEQYSQPDFPSVRKHRLRPRLRVRPDDGNSLQQPFLPFFDPGFFLFMYVFAFCAELAGTFPDMDGYLQVFLVEDFHHATVPANPYLAAGVFWRHRIICAPDFDIAVAVDRPPPLLEAWEKIGGKLLQKWFFPLEGGADLLPLPMFTPVYLPVTPDAA